MTAGTPYRTASPTGGLHAPSELIYPVRSADRLLTTTRLVAQVGFLGVLVGVAAHMGLGPVPTALAAGIAVLAPLWRRPTHVPSVVLRVENGILDMTRPASDSRRRKGAAQTLLRVELGFLTNVGLDTKTIRRVEQGNAITTALRFIDSKVGPEVDVARIVFEVDGRAAPVRLAEAYASHMESIEWLGKIRSFLRSHGWVPEDEREDDVD